MLFFLVLIIVGILAGITSTAAGLASLVSYPALTALGLSPIMANVTNTFGSITSSFSSLAVSLPELKGHSPKLKAILPITFIGAVLGSFLLFMIPSKIFQKLVPFFMLLAAYMMLHPTKKTQKTASKSKISSFIGLFLISIYMGYFGAGSGILILACLLNLYPQSSFAENNALKNAAGGLTNLISMVIYAYKVTIPWNYVIPMALGFFVGGLLGPIIARQIPALIMKRIVALGAVILAIVLFVRYY